MFATNLFFVLNFRLAFSFALVYNNKKDEAIKLITDYYCKHNLIMGTGEHQLGDNTNSTGFDRILNFDVQKTRRVYNFNERRDGYFKQGITF